LRKGRGEEVRARDAWIALDLARAALDAECFEEPAQVRGDPRIDLGVGRLSLGHGRFHLLEGDFEGRAAPAKGEFGLGHEIGARPI